MTLSPAAVSGIQTWLFCCVPQSLQPRCRPPRPEERPVKSWLIRLNHPSNPFSNPWTLYQKKVTLNLFLRNLWSHRFAKTRTFTAVEEPRWYLICTISNCRLSPALSLSPFVHTHHDPYWHRLLLWAGEQLRWYQPSLTGSSACSSLCWQTQGRYAQVFIELLWWNLLFFWLCSHLPHVSHLSLVKRT